MAFYSGRCIDPSGGMYHFYLDDGTVYDAHSRHLVSATRFVVNAATAFEVSGNPRFSDMAAHALRFIEQAFADPEHGGYHWLIRWQDGKSIPVDRTRHMYGLAFVMLAAARAHRIGVAGAKAMLESGYALAERHFFEPAFGLYADDATFDWQVSDYRGQNANMHCCEALIAAFEATGEARYVERAEVLAHAITVRQAALCNDGIWEHYDTQWQPDLEYNRHDSSNIFRPWGFQPGHFTEWAKLLCQLDAVHPQPWHQPRAEALFDRAMQQAWDRTHGGMHYGVGLDGSICLPEKYHWVQAESLAAAAVLAHCTGQPRFWNCYDQLWAYCWRHFVDHQQGAWFRILDAENRNHTREKSPAGKVDYHNIGACYDVLRTLQGGASKA